MRSALVAYGAKSSPVDRQSDELERIETECSVAFDAAAASEAPFVFAFQ